MKEIIKRAKKLLKEPYEDQDYFQWLELTYMAALMDKYLTDLCLMGPLLHYGRTGRLSAQCDLSRRDGQTGRRPPECFKRSET